MQKYQITHRKSTPYHPQANMKVESSNKVPKAILTNTVQMHKKDWSERILEVLWVYKITWISTTEFCPYKLVYGKQFLSPIEFHIRTFKMAAELGMDLAETKNQRLLQLNELDEII